MRGTLLSIAIVSFLVLGMMSGLATAEESSDIVLEMEADLISYEEGALLTVDDTDDVSYMDGVLNIAIDVTGIQPTIVKLCDGQIISDGPPSLIVIVKLQKDVDEPDSSVINIKLLNVGGNEDELDSAYPETIILKVRGVVDEPDSVPGTIILKVRGVVDEPDSIDPIPIILIISR